MLVGLFGMTSKFCECTLGVKYRTIENGKVYGGPMQYLKKGGVIKDFSDFVAGHHASMYGQVEANAENS